MFYIGFTLVLTAAMVCFLLFSAAADRGGVVQEALAPAPEQTPAEAAAQTPESQQVA